MKIIRHCKEQLELVQANLKTAEEELDDLNQQKAALEASLEELRTELGELKVKIKLALICLYKKNCFFI